MFIESLTDGDLVHYVQGQNKVEQILATIRDTIGSGVGFAEEKLSQVLEVSRNSTGTVVPEADVL